MGWWSYSDVQRIEAKVDLIMADLRALQSAATEIQGDVQTAIAKLEDLARQVSAGGDVSQADIDAITEQLRSADSALDDAVAGGGVAGLPDDSPAEPAPTPGAPTPGDVDPATPGAPEDAGGAGGGGEDGGAPDAGVPDAGVPDAGGAPEDGGGPVAPGAPVV